MVTVALVFGPRYGYECCFERILEKAYEMSVIPIIFDTFEKRSLEPEFLRKFPKSFLSLIPNTELRPRPHGPKMQPVLKAVWQNEKETTEVEFVLLVKDDTDAWKERIRLKERFPTKIFVHERTVDAWPGLRVETSPRLVVEASEGIELGKKIKEMKFELIKPGFRRSLSLWVSSLWPR